VRAIVFVALVCFDLGLLAGGTAAVIDAGRRRVRDSIRVRQLTARLKFHEDRLRTIIQSFEKENSMADSISDALDALAAQVASLSTLIDSAVTIIGGISTSTDVPGDLAKIQAISDKLKAEATALGAAEAPPAAPPTA
jgi:septation ring formation regulator EzrA